MAQSDEAPVEPGTWLGANKVVASIPHPDGLRVLVISINEYRETEYASVRWYNPGEIDPLTPTKKGVTFPLEWLGQVIDGLESAAETPVYEKRFQR